jgi:hypothetical protein
VAAIWTLVVLAVLTTVVGFVTWESVTAIRQIERRHHRLQALWLARSGVERAAARLLNDPAGYTGETLEIIPQSQVRIEVATEADQPHTFVVTCEARYPSDERQHVVRTESRRFRRSTDKDRRRLEIVAP